MDGSVITVLAGALSLLATALLGAIGIVVNSLLNRIRALETATGKQAEQIASLQAYRSARMEASGRA